MSVRWYPAVVERAKDGFGVVFPDVPGCTSAGDTVEEALSNAAEALEGHIELLVEHGEPVPEPGPPDAPVPDWLGEDVDVVVRVLVPVEMPGRAMRLNITLDEGLVRRIDRVARALGMSRSGFLAEAARRMLRERGDGQGKEAA